MIPDKLLPFFDLCGQFQCIPLPAYELHRIHTADLCGLCFHTPFLLLPLHLYAKPLGLPGIRTSPNLVFFSVYQCQKCMGDNPAPGITPGFAENVKGLQIGVLDAGFFVQFTIGSLLCALFPPAKSARQRPAIPTGKRSSPDQQQFQPFLRVLPVIRLSDGSIPLCMGSQSHNGKNRHISGN